MYDLRIVVDEIGGFCDLPVKIGDYFEVRGGKIVIPEGGHICLWALQSMMPAIPAKQRESAEDNDWLPDTDRFVCPDPNGRVIYRLERVDPVTHKPVKSEREKTGPAPRILVDEDSCTGCRACETACSFIHSENFNGRSARIKIEKRETEGEDLPLVCRQCGNAPCVDVCPTGALVRDPYTRAVLVKEEDCIGCRKCAEVCRFQVISFSREDKPLICDLCQGDPDCVKRCPVGAIKYGNAEKIME